MIERFIKYLDSERRFSQHTVKAYEKDVNVFLEFAAIEDEVALNEVTYHIVRAWIVELINSGHSNRTVNRKLSSLRTFFKWAIRSEIIKNDPMVRIRGPRQEKRLPEFVKEEELEIEKVNKLFPEGIEGQRDRLIIEVLYQTGVRLSELINIKTSDLQNSTLRVLGKRNKERIIPITKELEYDIKEYVESTFHKESNSAFLFLTDKGEKLYPKFVYRKVKYYLSLLTNLEKRSPHILRHTFATHILNNGAGLETIKELLGHADLSATQVYTHNSFEQIAKIYQNSHPRGKN
ncbi:MAG: tyrosine-type recombinase/integrase [Brumimicrobium sp.]